MNQTLSSPGNSWSMVPFSEMGHCLYITAFIGALAREWDHCSCSEEKQVNLYIARAIIQSTFLGEEKK